jgi:hypothetical protein
MSIVNLTAITDVGMWVTPTGQPYGGPCTNFLESPTFKYQLNNAFRSDSGTTLKTEKRLIIKTNRFSLQAGIKPP